MNLFVLAALLNAFTLAPLIAPARADVVPKKYLGTYQGISIEEVASGESFERATTRLRVTRGGLYMLVHRDDRGRAWERFYSVNWIVANRQPCLGILRGMGDGNVAFALCLKDLIGAEWPELAMLTPDGRRLVEYVRESKGPSGIIKGLMRKRFDYYRRGSAVGSLTQVRRVLAGADDRAKVAELSVLGRTLADRPESDIAPVMAVVDRALESSNLAVQRAGLNVIAGGGLFTQALPTLERLVARHADLHPDLLSTATRTLGGLVDEANELFRRRDEFERTFGTLDIDLLFARTNGVVRAGARAIDELEIFNLYPAASRAWTAELREQALRTLDLLARHAQTVEARREAVDVIALSGGVPVPVRERCEFYFGPGANQTSARTNL